VAPLAQPPMIAENMPAPPPTWAICRPPGRNFGSGLAATNLAGRTLADLVSGTDSELTRLPWVGRRVRTWEPEPIRWLGVQAMYAMYRRADRDEYRSESSKTSPIARFANAISGR